MCIRDSLQPVRERCDIRCEHRALQRTGQVNFTFWQPQQDVLAQRSAEQPRRLRRVRAARRLKPRRGIVDKLSVPADLAGVVRQQAEQRAQQGRLARADLTRDYGERAARQVERYIVNAAPVGRKNRCQPTDFQHLKPISRYAARRRR